MANKPEGGTVVFVLGLLGLLMCQVLGIVAWVLGNSYMDKCRAMNVEPEGIAVAGRILGIISTVLFGLGIILTILSLLVFGWVGWNALPDAEDDPSQIEFEIEGMKQSKTMFSTRPGLMLARPGAHPRRFTI